MNNKPFDLQKALAGEPVISGTENMTAEYLCTVNNVRSGTCHIFKIKFMDSSSSLPSEAVYFFTDRGIGYTNQQLTVRASHVDLFMAPVKKTVWVNIYSKPSQIGEGAVIQATQHPHDDQGTAKACRDNLVSNGYSVHATVPIEIEL